MLCESLGKTNLSNTVIKARVVFSMLAKTRSFSSAFTRFLASVLIRPSGLVYTGLPRLSSPPTNRTVRDWLFLRSRLGEVEQHYNKYFLFVSTLFWLPVAASAMRSNFYVANRRASSHVTR